MFGKQMPIGDFQMPQMDASVGQPLQMPPTAPKKKGGMFGSGVGGASVIQALLTGYLASRGGPLGAAALQMFQQKRQQALEEAQYQKHRGESLDDYAKKQQIEAQYGAPPAPHYFEDNSGNQWAIGADGVPKMVHKDDLPFKLVPNGLGGVVPVDLRSLMAGQGGQDEILDQLPPGAKPIGGPGPMAPGGFPRSY